MQDDLLDFTAPMTPRPALDSVSHPALAPAPTPTLAPAPTPTTVPAPTSTPSPTPAHLLPSSASPSHHGACHLVQHLCEREGS